MIPIPGWHFLTVCMDCKKISAKGGKVVLVRALRLAGVTLLAAAAIVVPSSPALAAPAFKVPFPCGQTWTGQTRTNHSPANAIDFNRSDDLGDPVVASAGGTVDVVTNLGSTSYGK